MEGALDNYMLLNLASARGLWPLERHNAKCNKFQAEEKAAHPLSDYAVSNISPFTFNNFSNGRFLNRDFQAQLRK